MRGSLLRAADYEEQECRSLNDERVSTPGRL
jgi:hypothetical protein